MIFQQMDTFKNIFRQRGRKGRRERDRERDIDVRVKHRSDASQLIFTGDCALTANQTSNILMHR